MIPTRLCPCQPCRKRRRAAAAYGIMAALYAAACLALGIMGGQIAAYLTQ